MNRLAHISALLALGPAAALALAAPAAAHPTEHRTSQPALFVQTDALTGNSVVAYARTSDGTLQPEGNDATGGLGGILRRCRRRPSGIPRAALRYDRPTACCSPPTPAATRSPSSRSKAPSSAGPR